MAFSTFLSFIPPSSSLPSLVRFSSWTMDTRTMKGKKKKTSKKTKPEIDGVLANKTILVAVCRSLFVLFVI